MGIYYSTFGYIWDEIMHNFTSFMLKYSIHISSKLNIWLFPIMLTW